MQATAPTHRESGSPRADSQILRPHKQQYLTSSALSSGNNWPYWKCDMACAILDSMATTDTILRYSSIMYVAYAINNIQLH